MKRKKIIIILVLIVLAALAYYFYRKGSLSLSGADRQNIGGPDVQAQLDQQAQSIDQKLTDAQKIQQLKGSSAKEVFNWGVKNPRLNPFLNPFMAPAFVVGLFKKPKE
jgi:hypothetical protein